jgi:hypothetical protein
VRLAVSGGQGLGAGATKSLIFNNAIAVPAHVAKCLGLQCEGAAEAGQLARSSRLSCGGPVGGLNVA